MVLTPEQELENAIIKVNYHIVCDLFELTPEQRLNPACGQWIVDVIKQFQTSFTIMRAAKLMKSEQMENKNDASLPPINRIANEEPKV